jgi:hypothetical protein
MFISGVKWLLRAGDTLVVRWVDRWAAQLHRPPGRHHQGRYQRHGV